MSDGLAIDDAVLTLLQGDAQLSTLAPGGVYPDTAPEGAVDTGVYGIVGLQAHEDVYEQPGRTAMELPRFLVKFVSRDVNGAAARAAYSRAHALLQGQALAITGYHWMDTVREFRIRFTELDPPSTWRHVGGVYRVEADPA